MATIDTQTAPRTNQLKWVPVLCGIAVICMESTNKMGAAQTGIWLRQWLGLYGQSGAHAVELLNHYLRKGGHFTGYGFLGLFFSSAWLSVLRRRVAATWSGMRLRAGVLGVASTLVVASADEIHQIFLPSRGASIYDVMLDTGGALTVNLIFFGFLALRRNALLQPGPFTTLGLSFAGLPQRMSGAREMRGILGRSARGVAAMKRTVRKTDFMRLDSAARRRYI